MTHIGRIGRAPEPHKSQNWFMEVCAFLVLVVLPIGVATGLGAIVWFIIRTAWGLS